MEDPNFEKCFKVISFYCIELEDQNFYKRRISLFDINFNLIPSAMHEKMVLLDIESDESGHKIINNDFQIFAFTCCYDASYIPFL